VFVDASVIVSIVTDEDDGKTLAHDLDGAVSAMTSPIAIWEAAASISRKTGRRAGQELPDILTFLELAGIEIVPIDLAVSVAAIAAFDRYGRRSGHSADLNMGDCFAYAFAKTRGVPLLYKGKDFALTDLARSV
jgi:ribonuclease VapC